MDRRAALAMTDRDVIPGREASPESIRAMMPDRPESRRVQTIQLLPFQVECLGPWLASRPGMTALAAAGMTVGVRTIQAGNAS